MSDREQNTGAQKATDSGSEQDNTGNLARGYGDGGATPFGQLAQGASNRAEGGFGGDSVGGYGQQNLNSQAGQGGYGPLTQGAGYGQGGGQFGPPGSDSQSAQAPYGEHPDHRPRQGDYRRQGERSARPGDYGTGGGSSPRQGIGSYAQQDYSPAAQRSKLHDDQMYTGPGSHSGPGPGAPHHDDHEPHYRHWRDTQLAGHDRDYARWREEQARKYDEDYRGWRGERHSAFSKEFEGWRAGRGGASEGSANATASAPTTPNVNEAHGANPALADIADGHAGERRDGSHHPRDRDNKAS